MSLRAPLAMSASITVFDWMMVKTPFTSGSGANTPTEQRWVTAAAHASAEHPKAVRALRSTGDWELEMRAITSDDFSTSSPQEIVHRHSTSLAATSGTLSASVANNRNGVALWLCGNSGLLRGNTLYTCDVALAVSLQRHVEENLECSSKGIRKPDHIVGASGRACNSPHRKNLADIRHAQGSKPCQKKLSLLAKVSNVVAASLGLRSPYVQQICALLRGKH